MTGRIDKNATKLRRTVRAGLGISQLQLVEHCLCPLSAPPSPFTHKAEYFYWKNGHKRQSTAVVRCELGLKPDDELYLWMLLELARRQAEQDGRLYAGPRYLLRVFGLTEGGSNAAHLRSVIHRVGNVSYRDENFYDPVRKERRDVSFKFFSYDLPKDNESFRPWFIAFDGVFWELSNTPGGYLTFDLELCRKLRPACRRMLLWLTKVFYGKREVSPTVDVKHFCIHQIGFADGLRATDYNKKLFACVCELSEEGIVCRPSGGIRGLCKQIGRGRFQAEFRPGPYFAKERQGEQSPGLEEHPLYDSLKEKIKLDDGVIRRVLGECPKEEIALWIDVTLVAQKLKGRGFFKRSPQAFFMNGIYANYGPPDWYYEYNRQRERSKDAVAKKNLGTNARIVWDRPAPLSEGLEQELEFRAYLSGDEGRKYFHELASDVFAGDATKAEQHMRKQFVTRQEHQRNQSSQPQPVGSIFRFTAQ